MARQEVDADYMAPFLALMDDPDVEELTLDQAHRLRELCLVSCKQQLVDTAQTIHQRFEKAITCYSSGSVGPHSGRNHCRRRVVRGLG